MSSENVKSVEDTTKSVSASNGDASKDESQNGLKPKDESKYSSAPKKILNKSETTEGEKNKESKYLKRIDVAFVMNGKHFHKVLKSNVEYLKMLEILLEALRNNEKIDNYIVLQKNEIKVD